MVAVDIDPSPNHLRPGAPSVGGLLRAQLVHMQRFIIHRVPKKTLREENHNKFNHVLKFRFQRITVPGFKITLASTTRSPKTSREVRRSPLCSQESTRLAQMS